MGPDSVECETAPGANALMQEEGEKKRKKINRRMVNLQYGTLKGTAQLAKLCIVSVAKHNPIAGSQELYQMTSHVQCIPTQSQKRKLLQEMEIRLGRFIM